MSINISGGIGGGGITIETDPTALKIASNLSDLADPSQAIVNLGAIGEAPNDGTIYGRQSGEWVAAGGSSTTELYLSGYSTESVANSVSLKTQNSSYNGSVEILSEGGQGATLACSQLDGYGYRHAGLFCATDGLGASFKYGYHTASNTYGWITDQPIILPDGSVLNTAGGGGSGSGTSVQQRYADAIAALTATPTCGYDGGVYVAAQWAFASAYNNNSLYYEYPKFIDAISQNGYAVAIYVQGVYFPLNYIDYNYLTGWASGDYGSLSINDYLRIAVTSTSEGTGFEDSTTTALSFPAGFTTYYPV